MRVIDAGHWHDGDPGILVVFDSGYDLTRLAWLLRDLPAEVAGWLRSDRVMYFPAPPRPANPARTAAHPGTAPRSGSRTRRPGPPRRSPPRPRPPGTAPPPRRAPVIGGTLIRLAVGHLPGDRSPEPLWLWSSRAGTCAGEVNRTGQAFLRRFDIEHTFRFFK